ncbi:hypothetical protein RQM59_04570 [Flavobacteriaceae bacterium S356]|uniref:DoxX family protein n=1 Tax=Asprobacillus argus TaxID=3076534 RepID=A0ABU3LD52_9FLAO|nr:hypothetical protein [Flavobacteriaceae bacterium S356]
MKTKKFLSKILLCFSSLVITLFFIPNALDKIVHPDQTGKVIENSAIMVGTGVFLLVATGLFLYHKTVLLGTMLLSLYMTLIVCIHMYKGKPYEVAMLIVMATLFAAYIRKPNFTS